MEGRRRGYEAAAEWPKDRGQCADVNLRFQISNLEFQISNLKSEIWNSTLQICDPLRSLAAGSRDGAGAGHQAWRSELRDDALPDLGGLDFLVRRRGHVLQVLLLIRDQLTLD